MDKDTTNYNHTLSIKERKSIVITGVKKIENFDENEFLIDTTMGYITIKGSDLEIIKLDTYQGDISIKGKIDSLNYTETSKKTHQESVLSKLFK